MVKNFIGNLINIRWEILVPTKVVDQQISVFTKNKIWNI